MRQIIKVNNNELSFRLKLNYNNVHSRLRMLLGKSASLFADIKPMPVFTAWYAEDDADYTALSDAPKAESREIMVRLSSVLKNTKKAIDNSKELAPFADDILEVPDNRFIFYRKLDDGAYKFVLAGWGCKQSHTAVSETGGLIKRVSKSLGVDEEPVKPGKTTGKTGNTDDIVGQSGKKGDSAGSNTPGGETSRIGEPVGLTPPVEKELRYPEDVLDGQRPDGLYWDEVKRKAVKTDDVKNEEDGTASQPKKKKEQHVLLKVINQNNKPVEDEDVKIRTSAGDVSGVTDENGFVEVGNLPYHSTFNVSFPNIPNIQERAYEVEPKVEMYEAYIKKYVNYSPVLFVEDQNGNVVDNYNIKVVIAGQDNILNTGANGMIQLPTMQEGQKFIVIDSANYANSEEYSVTPETVKRPFRFTIKRTLKSKIGITVLNKDKKPIEGATVNVKTGDNPCQQTTDKNGRTEFPSEIFTPGEVDVELYVPGKGKINSKLNFVPETTEYSIQLTGKKRNGGFNWKWLLLLPLLLLVGLGGRYLYEKIKTPDVPTIAEMEKGVVMLFGYGSYYADLNVQDVTAANGMPLTAYFLWDDEGNFQGYTFDAQVGARSKQAWSGTGFLITEDGFIATNKHVADPTPPEELAKFLKTAMQNQKDYNQQRADHLNSILQSAGGYHSLSPEGQQIYSSILDSIQYYQHQVRLLDKILNTGDFAIKKDINLFAAFTGNRVENIEDLIPCSQPRAVGEPGGVTENDLAIIQIKKKNEIPADAFVFEVPENDLMDEQIPDNYDIIVLGYNAGPGLQFMKYQDGIIPQAQYGKVSSVAEKYRIGYNAPIIGGSSGAPVINNKGELVAINNSKSHEAAGISWGVRTKYLKELLDGIRNNKSKDSQNPKEIKEQRRRIK